MESINYIKNTSQLIVANSVTVLQDIRGLAACLGYKPKTIEKKISLIRHGKLVADELPPLCTDNPPRWNPVDIAEWMYRQRYGQQADISSPALKPHRGRPTKAEQVASRLAAGEVL